MLSSPHASSPSCKKSIYYLYLDLEIERFGECSVYDVQIRLELWEVFLSSKKKFKFRLSSSSPIDLILSPYFSLVFAAQSFPYEKHCVCTKSSHQDCDPCYLHAPTFFFYIHSPFLLESKKLLWSLLSSGK